MCIQQVREAGFLCFGGNEHSHCTGSSEQNVELCFTRVAGDLTCGVPAEIHANEMKRSFNRSANGGWDLSSLAWATCLRTSRKAENDRLTFYEPLPNSLFYCKSHKRHKMSARTETCELARVNTNQPANTHSHMTDSTVKYHQ